MSTVIDQMAADASERQAHQDPAQFGAREGGNVWYAEPEPFFCADETAFRVAFVITTIISLVAVVALGLHLHYRFFN